MFNNREDKNNIVLTKSFWNDNIHMTIKSKRATEFSITITENDETNSYKHIIKRDHCDYQITDMQLLVNELNPGFFVGVLVIDDAKGHQRLVVFQYKSEEFVALKTIGEVSDNLSIQLIEDKNVKAAILKFGDKLSDWVLAGIEWTNFNNPFHTHFTIKGIKE